MVQKEKTETWPPPLDSHSAIADVENKKIYLFGGLAKYQATADTYEFTIETGKWKKLETKGPTPAPRSNHSAAFYNSSMVIYGGINNDGDVLGDMWELNVKTGSWTQTGYKTPGRVPDVCIVSSPT